jgi:hypothetical protein
MYIKCPRCKANFELDHSQSKSKFFKICAICEYRFFVNSEAGCPTSEERTGDAANTHHRR